MIWTHAGRLHWVSHDLEGVDGQVRVIDGISYWEVIDTEDGRILYSGQCNQTLDAMKLSAEYIKALEEIRSVFNGIETKTSECTSKEEKTEILNESESHY